MGQVCIIPDKRTPSYREHAAGVPLGFLWCPMGPYGVCLRSQLHTNSSHEVMLQQSASQIWEEKNKQTSLEISVGLENFFS